MTSSNQFSESIDTLPQISSDVAVATEPVVDEDSLVKVTRQHPIPPPSEEMQYRAIGLVKGCYSASEEQFTRGSLLTPDGTTIDAVLLGRVMSLVKNHLDLEQAHLWVVYPRTRQKDDELHTQIVGVWEPETLAQAETTDGDRPENDTSEVLDGTPKEMIPSPARVEDGYFSIRGEVIFQSKEKSCIVVKIRQSPRPKENKPRFFKLTLYGTIEKKALGNFWEFHLLRRDNMLMIQEANDIGPIPHKRKKPFARKGGGGGGRYGAPSRKRVGAPRPSRPVGSSPVPKPQTDR